MKFDESDLLRAQRDGIISVDVFNKLLMYLKSSKNRNVVLNDTNKQIGGQSSSKFTIENFLYYFGAFIIISTMGWYLGSIWKSFSHIGLLVCSIIYFAFFTIVGNFLWNKDKKTPAGLLYVCAVSIVPLLVWAFENLVGIMPKELSEYRGIHLSIRSGWIMMEMATIIVGFVFLKFRKFPLLTLPICYALWYLSMDIVPLFMGQISSPTWGMRNFATFVFSIAMLGYDFILDIKKDKVDFSHWLYIFGATMLWFVTFSIFFHLKWNNEFARFVLGLLNFIYMLIGIVLERRVFLIYGAIGFWGYLGHLAYRIFIHTPLFPVVLVVFGLSVIFSGIYYSKNCTDIENKIRNFIGVK